MTIFIFKNLMIFVVILPTEFGAGQPASAVIINMSKQ